MISRRKLLAGAAAVVVAPVSAAAQFRYGDITFVNFVSGPVQLRDADIVWPPGGKDWEDVMEEINRRRANMSAGDFSRETYTSVRELARRK